MLAVLSFFSEGSGRRGRLARPLQTKGDSEFFVYEKHTVEGLNPVTATESLAGRARDSGVAFT
jgi:hypothetical protein